MKRMIRRRQWYQTRLTLRILSRKFDFIATNNDRYACFIADRKLADWFDLKDMLHNKEYERFSYLIVNESNTDG